MAPSTPIEISPEAEVKQRKTVVLVLPEKRKEVAASAVRALKLPARPEEGSFHSSMLEFNQMKSSSRLLDTLISLTVNTCLLIAPLFLGLYFTDSLDMKQFASTFLVAPPPPPPPPPAPAA